MMPRARQAESFEPAPKSKPNRFGLVEGGPTKVMGFLFNGETVDYFLEDFTMPIRGKEGASKSRILSPGDVFPLWVERDGKPKMIEVTYLGVEKAGNATVPIVQADDGKMYPLRKSSPPNAIDQGLFFLEQ